MKSKQQTKQCSADASALRLERDSLKAQLSNAETTIKLQAEQLKTLRRALESMAMVAAGLPPP